jgi:uncharacterized protein (TIGR03437 family)
MRDPGLIHFKRISSMTWEEEPKMKPIFIASLVSAALIVSATAQPKINTNGIVNVASYAVAGLPDSSIAQGSIFVIFGANMGPATLVGVGSFPIPPTLGGTSVKIVAGGQTLDAPMFYTIAGQVAAIMPSNTPVGTAAVTVTYNGVSSAPQNVQVVANTFGVFAVNQQGNGAGVITDVNYRPFLATASARPGDVAIIWGTGLGPVTFGDTGQPQATDMTNIPVQVYVGGKLANILYRGRSGCCAGLDQIVINVPAGVEGCTVPLVVRIGSVVSNTTTMPISSSSNHVCSDPNGIAPTDLLGLLGKPNFNLGGVTLLRSTNVNTLPAPFGGTTTSDTGSASFINYTSASFTGLTGSFQQPAIGSCIVSTFSTASGSPPIPTFVGLDAGPAINVTGPKGQKQLPQSSQQKGFYSAALSSGTPPAPTVTFLDAGSYAINNGSGGADIKGFAFNMNVPQPLTWNELNTAGNTPIDRTSPYTVTWSGGAPGTLVEITGSSIVIGPPTVVASFLCFAPQEALRFTIGPDVLLQLPSSSVISAGGFTISTSSLAVGNVSNPVKFTAPGLDYGSANSLVLNSTNVTYK